MYVLRIALTGVESVGKTTLLQELVAHYGGVGIAEFAREYLAGKDSYTQEDVLKIAETQIKRQNQVFQLEPTSALPILFFDTDLTVIKIWYETKYQTSLPTHIAEEYAKQHFDLYLLPYPDLVWEKDALREAPNFQTRMTLFERYEAELKALKRPYHIIKGEGQARLQEAIRAIDLFLK